MLKPGAGMGRSQPDPLIVKSCLRLTHERLGSKALNPIRAPSLTVVSRGAACDICKLGDARCPFTGMSGCGALSLPHDQDLSTRPLFCGVLDVGRESEIRRINSRAFCVRTI